MSVLPVVKSPLGLFILAHVAIHFVLAEIDIPSTKVQKNMPWEVVRLETLRMEPCRS